VLTRVIQQVHQNSCHPPTYSQLMLEWSGAREKKRAEGMQAVRVQSYLYSGAKICSKIS